MPYSSRTVNHSEKCFYRGPFYWGLVLQETTVYHCSMSKGWAGSGVGKKAINTLRVVQDLGDTW